MTGNAGSGSAPTSRSTPRFRWSRNSPQAFLLGASWSHDAAWPTRTTHLYLGPWLLTMRTTKNTDSSVSEAQP